jgi:3-hydroxyisobutyrate dehydrogenase-like beta-hydroxyacid dehydrogenase
MKIGFLGLGIMGSRMAANLVEHGHTVTVWNRSKGPEAALAGRGAEAVTSPAEAVKDADCAVAMLTGPEAVDDVLFGQDGAAQELEGKLFVNMSTVSPAYSRGLAKRLKEQGVRFMDAPVSGSKKPAEDGTLVILAGGDAGDVSFMQPAFDAMGGKTVHCGEAGTGSMMKMSVNLLLGVMMHGLSEMLHFGEKGGLSRQQLLDVVLGGPLSNMLYQLKRDMYLSDTYPAQFPLMHMDKDLGFVLETAFDTGADIPASTTVRFQYERALKEGFGEEDFAAVIKALGK